MVYRALEGLQCPTPHIHRRLHEGVPEPRVTGDELALVVQGVAAGHGQGALRPRRLPGEPRHRAWRPTQLLQGLDLLLLNAKHRGQASHVPALLQRL